MFKFSFCKSAKQSAGPGPWEERIAAGAEAIGLWIQQNQKMEAAARLPSAGLGSGACVQ